MHNAAIATLGIEAVYVAIRTSPDALPHLMRAFEATGIGGNITVPHKVEASRLLIRLTPMAKKLQAVNTFWSDGHRLVGDNTDVDGLLDALDHLDAGSPWLVAGTGGAARAVAAAAAQRNVRLLVRSRSEERAREFLDWASRCLNVDIARDDGSDVATAINCTPLGLRGDDPPPFPAERIEACAAALDLVYAPGTTRWVRTCRALGLRAEDGRRMLVAQGARSFERFFPGKTAPREVMKHAVERALEG